MSRPVRVEYPGAVYHIVTRGNARRPVFRDDVDRELFLRILGRTVARWSWLCYAYCLMPNHYHLLIETPEGILSRGMRQLNGEYTQAFNRRHRRCGHLFQGRFHAVVVEKQRHLLELCRYIALNPVRAPRLRVDDPGDYPWSSFNATAGLSPAPPFLAADRLLAHFHRLPSRAHGAYADFVRGGLGVRHEPTVRDGLWLGSEAFGRSLQRHLEKLRAVPDHPRAQRQAGRPSLAAFLPVDVVSLPSARDAAIARAYHEGRFTQKEIGDHLGLHFTTVSAIVRRAGTGATAPAEADRRPD